jgi:ribose 5-phosphate isomerase B
VYFSMVGIVSDHAGKDLKKLLVEFLSTMEIAVEDLGVAWETEASVDYPDYAGLLASKISQKKLDGGIAICGTGIGMSIAANKYPGVRAGVVWNEYTCRMSREHNNSNLLCLGARALNEHRAADLVKIWLDTPFANGHHQLRIDKISKIEKKNGMHI